MQHPYAFEVGLDFFEINHLIIILSFFFTAYQKPMRYYTRKLFNKVLTNFSPSISYYPVNLQQLKYIGQKYGIAHLREGPVK